MTELRFFMIFGSYDDLLNLRRALSEFFNHGQWNNGGVIKIHVQNNWLDFQYFLTRQQRSMVDFGCK